jgi:hypothetical protein
MSIRGGAERKHLLKHSLEIKESDVCVLSRTHYYNIRQNIYLKGLSHEMDLAFNDMYG